MSTRDPIIHILFLGVLCLQDFIPSFVFQSPGGRNWQVGTPPQNFYLFLECSLFSVMRVACCLSRVSNDLQLDPATINLRESESLLHGTLHRVRVAAVTCRPKKTVTNLFYGKMTQLEWDPNKFVWLSNIQFMMYNSKIGRQWLTNRHVLLDVVPHGFCLQWSTIWDKQRIRKEASLFWRMSHRAIEVNAWRGVINVNLVQNCSVCRIGTREMILHCFWECKTAKDGWAWDLVIIRALANGPRSQRRWALINWKQSIFSYQVPRRFRDIGHF